MYKMLVETARQEKTTKKAYAKMEEYQRNGVWEYGLDACGS